MKKYILKGRLIDGVSDNALENGLLCFGETIEYAGPAEGFRVPEGSEILDAGRNTILPGFIDCHAHLSGDEDSGGSSFFGDQLLGAAHQMGVLLDAGFTGLRDMSEAGLYLSRAVSRGILRGPRILPGGKILGVTGGHVDASLHLPKELSNATDHSHRLVDGVDDCVLGVREQFRAGARFIKVCATGGVSSPGDSVDDVQFSPDELKAIVEETKRHHGYVAAHCTGNEGAYQALKAGVSSIEHGVFLTQREIDLMAELGVPLVTTLAVSLGVAKLPDLPGWMAAKAKGCAEANVKTIAMARKAGIGIALGTDFSNTKNFPYKNNGAEFVAMVEAGMTPMEAVKAGTSNAARLMMDGRIGSLEIGKLADIVVVEGDPLADIKALRGSEKVMMVFQGGKRVKG
ncbi:MAG: amidohydrolase family protein [Spirochaetaceae bacterium]|nr:amidohydrolase family protein [Spirochaetaceae bacterium]